MEVGDNFIKIYNMEILEKIDCIYILNLINEKYKFDKIKEKLLLFNPNLKIKRFIGVDGNSLEQKEIFFKKHQEFYNNLNHIKKNIILIRIPQKKLELIYLEVSEHLDVYNLI